MKYFSALCVLVLVLLALASPAHGCDSGCDNNSGGGSSSSSSSGSSGSSTSGSQTGGALNNILASQNNG
ncbi:unnamed protein product [Plutella xylostella]|uniref:(diamondback moth) hypothetical protein n=1 Tax=Plutella xylostella TaxID=51655 RepID=A0A8S4G839_PLUXY|nr:unnamed protein product [Plutella xylostella]